MQLSIKQAQMIDHLHMHHYTHLGLNNNKIINIIFRWQGKHYGLNI